MVKFYYNELITCSHLKELCKCKRVTDCLLERWVSFFRCPAQNKAQNEETKEQNKTQQQNTNKAFPSCFEPHDESEAECKAFHIKFSLLAYE